MVFNAGTGDKYFGWCDLICKGTGKSITAAYKYRWDKDVDIFWKNKSWVDSVAMIYLYQYFVAHKNEVHGEGHHVLR